MKRINKKLNDLEQYHFDRGSFVYSFYHLFTEEQVTQIEVFCESQNIFEYDFAFFKDEDEYYILHKPSGIMINWYKHLGRTNTCNREDFTIEDLDDFLLLLNKEVFWMEDVE